MTLLFLYQERIVVFVISSLQRYYGRTTSLLRGIREMRQRVSPVQQWVDSLPSPIKSIPLGSSSATSVPSDECCDTTRIEDRQTQLLQDNNYSHEKHQRLTDEMTLSTPSAIANNSPAISYSNVSRYLYIAIVIIKRQMFLSFEIYYRDKKPKIKQLN